MMYAKCATPDCANGGESIPIPDEHGTVVCGVCGNPITDVTATPPEPLPEEMPTWDL